MFLKPLSCFFNHFLNLKKQRKMQFLAVDCNDTQIKILFATIVLDFVLLCKVYLLTPSFHSTKCQFGQKATASNRGHYSSQSRIQSIFRYFSNANLKEMQMALTSTMHFGGKVFSEVIFFKRSFLSVICNFIKCKQILFQA